ncbi:GNAT family N-acetyltransferase [Planomicrobium sp. CPCC 101079]|uniref:GNAT family N-acetyltransferase n=1 Tax=Planomicrobium sp. CPCC 101079 TaxID=2599618 RepID=UPI0011B41E7C|nr:GNAT family N-acetyltransferase [Planomicrobium sp. CPCC 101079]TWT01918.1 GNAT family N-acetyltransferase [Planomicrobium sp. CPCC 101079]
MKVITKTTVPDIFFAPEWGKAYESHDHGEMRIFEVKNELGHIYYSFILRAIPIPVGAVRYYDTITSFGLSGPIILDCIPGKKRELAAVFDKEFQQYCKENNIVSEYVRFNSWLNNATDFEDVYCMDNRGIVMYVDLTVEDYFMQEFKSCTRQQVRRALKNNVEIEYDYTGASVKEFHRLYMIMAKKNNIPEHYMFSEELLAESFKHLEGKQFIVYAKYEGQYISGAIYLHHEDYLHYHLAANDPDFFNVAGNSLVLNEGCRWGVEHGKKQLHLGGASTEPLYRFKRGFTKTEPLAILTGKKVRNPEVYEWLTYYKQSTDAEADPGYFPAYRG